MANPLAEDKVYIVWTITNKNDTFTDNVSEVLCTTQNYLYAQEQQDVYADATDDDVYLTTITLGVHENIDTESSMAYPHNILSVGGRVRIGD